MEGERESRISNTIIQGTLGAPPVFACLLLIVSCLLGWGISKMYDVEKEMGKTGTELRLMQQQMQDTNAILLRRGYIQPGDLEAPARGSSPK